MPSYSKFGNASIGTAAQRREPGAWVDPGPGVVFNRKGLDPTKVQMSVPNAFVDPVPSGSYSYDYPTIRRMTALRGVGDDTSSSSALRDLINSDNVSTAAAAAMLYHGYKRTGSIFWALIYGLAGKVFPLETVPIAIAQGYGQKKSCP
jgi:hypothetical protein